MSKLTERTIQKIYTSVFNKIFNKVRIKELNKKNKKVINNVVKVLESSPEYEKFAQTFAKKLATQGIKREKGLWRKYYESAKKSHYIALPHTYSEFEKAVMKTAVKHNFTMIKTIPSKVLEQYERKYTNDLIEEVAEGKISRGSFEKQLKTNGVKNAKIIARTETAKLQSVIIEKSATALGSTCYFWKSSRDIRTRQSHRNMNGVVVFWRTDINEKPLLDNMNGNAGEFPNCRCTSKPIFDEYDLKQSNYKVYDYRQHKIITMNKSTLLKCIEKGELQ